MGNVQRITVTDRGAARRNGPRLPSLPVVAAVLTLAVTAARADDVAWRDVESRIQYGYYTEDTAALRKLEELIAAGDARDKLRGYYGGLLEWRRAQLDRLPNVTLYRGNHLAADEVIGLTPTHVVVATGARWARLLYSPLEVPAGSLDGPGVLTPDDLAAGVVPEDPVVVYDFDNYYLGGVLAEHLARGGHSVSYVTPAGHVSAWTIMSNEQPQVHRALAAAGVARHTLARVTAFGGGAVTLADQFTNAEKQLECRSLVIVGTRFGNDRLYTELRGRGDELADAGIRSVTRIGDALAPGALVHAVYSGHRYARELDADPASLGLRRDAPLAVAP